MAVLISQSNARYPRLDASPSSAVSTTAGMRDTSSCLTSSSRRSLRLRPICGEHRTDAARMVRVLAVAEPRRSFHQAYPVPTAFMSAGLEPKYRQVRCTLVHRRPLVLHNPVSLEGSPASHPRASPAARTDDAATLPHRLRIPLIGPSASIRARDSNPWDPRHPRGLPICSSWSSMILTTCDPDARQSCWQTSSSSSTPAS